MSKDCRFSRTGFKYPEQVYANRFNKPAPAKPLLQNQQPINPRTSNVLWQEKHMRYQKFGMNIGPKRPVIMLQKNNPGVKPFKETMEKQKKHLDQMNQNYNNHLASYNQAYSSNGKNQNNGIAPTKCLRNSVSASNLNSKSGVTLYMQVDNRPNPKFQGQNKLFWETSYKNQFDTFSPRATRNNRDCLLTSGIKQPIEQDLKRIKPRCASNYQRKVGIVAAQTQKDQHARAASMGTMKPQFPKNNGCIDLYRESAMQTFTINQPVDKQTNPSFYSKMRPTTGSNFDRTAHGQAFGRKTTQMYDQTSRRQYCQMSRFKRDLESNLITKDWIMKAYRPSLKQ